MLKIFSRKSIIPAVTIGSILEWYEIGLYIYWATIIERVLFDYAVPIGEAINAVSAISVGLIARPLGGYIFGCLGDHKGRKKAFTLAVVFISIPTLLIGFAPSYSDWNLFSITFIAIMKFLQGIPAGGEIPGAICYLAENSTDSQRRYACSFAFVGPQIGLLLSLTECLVLQEFLPTEDLLEWGWRISFLTCALLGALGFFLRRKLHESHQYKQLKDKHKALNHPIHEVFKKYKKRIVLGFCVSVFDTTAFCLLTVIPAIYFKQLFGLSDSQNLIICSTMFIICIVVPPFIGKMADRYKKFPMLELSAIVFILLSYPLYYYINISDLIYTLWIQFFLVVFFCIQVALLPSVIAGLYPTRVRYTGIGFSFNICDGVLWGLVPILSSFLIQKTGMVASFVIFYPISAIIFLISYYFIKKIEENKQNLADA